MFWIESVDGRREKMVSRRLCRFAVCVDAGGYTDLVPLKVYRARADAAAGRDGLVRVVD